ncbi:hypothetical protein Hanom_Chr05g00394241 [Helianthus anomalus]
MNLQHFVAIRVVPGAFLWVLLFLLGYMGGGCFITILYMCDPFFLSFTTKPIHITLHRQPSDKSQMALIQRQQQRFHLFHAQSLNLKQKHHKRRQDRVLWPRSTTRPPPTSWLSQMRGNPTSTRLKARQWNNR